FPTRRFRGRKVSGPVSERACRLLEMGRDRVVDPGLDPFGGQSRPDRSALLILNADGVEMLCVASVRNPCWSPDTRDTGQLRVVDGRVPVPKAQRGIKPGQTHPQQGGLKLVEPAVAAGHDV